MQQEIGWEELYLGGSLTAENQGKEIRRGFHNKRFPLKIDFQIAKRLT